MTTMMLRLTRAGLLACRCDPFRPCDTCRDRRLILRRFGQGK
jgi:hypothetical protein